jgi:hypothetical protein
MGPLFPLLATSALFAAAPFSDGYAFPPQQRGNLTATLSVRVAEKPVAPGQGRATLLIVVEGPPGLEVGPAHLEDAIEAWTAPARFSSWSRQGERVTCAVSLDLIQAKPGPAALPALRLRCREGPSSEWQELRWVDILKEARNVPPPEELPPLPPSPWPGRLRWLGNVLAGAMGLLALAWIVRRWRSGPAPPVPAHARALHDLAQLKPLAKDGSGEFYANLANVLRAYLGARFEVNTGHCTSDELLAELAHLSVLSVGELLTLRVLFERCDLAKFAGASPPIEEPLLSLELARALVKETAPAGEAPLTAPRAASGP